VRHPCCCNHWRLAQEVNKPGLKTTAIVSLLLSPRAEVGHHASVLDSKRLLRCVWLAKSGYKAGCDVLQNQVSYAAGAW
jgi:hypothetical protein